MLLLAPSFAQPAVVPPASLIEQMITRQMFKANALANPTRGIWGQSWKTLIAAYGGLSVWLQRILFTKSVKTRD